MTEQSPYELLGVTEGASFDEIQTARDRLVDASQEAGTKVEQIEAAYDAVLMHRLRMRQEGKIKVPERIRFPERSAPAPKPQETSPEITKKLPNWMQDLADQPSAMDIVLPALVTLVLMVIAVFYLQPAAEPAVNGGGDGALELVLACGVASSLYFLNRKEGKFGRAFFITMASMFAGLIVGSLLAIPLEGVLRNPQELATAATLTAKQFIVVVSLGSLWATSSFAR